MEKEDSRKDYVSPASLRPLSEDESLKSPTWIISEIFSQFMYNTKCINI